MQLDLILIPLNVAVYASIALGVMQGRRRRAAKSLAGAETAFKQLESALERRFPDLPGGFTMREGLSRARSVEPGLGWDRIEESLTGYESYRYGGGPAPSGEQSEVVKLARELRRAW